VFLALVKQSMTKDPKKWTNIGKAVKA